MSHTEQRNWLVAYDIANPRRLCRVHRFLKGHAIPVQYSVFVFQGSQMELQRVLTGISSHISPDEDDVRAYHLPDRCEVAMLGRQDLPDGIVLGGRGLGRLLQVLNEDESSPDIDVFLDNDNDPLEESCYLV
ncbi:MAG: CRISPR-associated endonuclease Cas2 [Acidobacteriota bacterium]|jgi:CRISPR-associated protein Cas2|nr:CRISPR-associated endonuclease Cas2 [Acidobacteriota bacterium]